MFEEKFKICFGFACSSILMILINKEMAIQLNSYVSILLLMQNLFTLLILIYTTKPHFEKEKGQKWVPCSIFFSINIFTSIISFLYINVPTFTIFRNLQPLLAIALNVVYPTNAPPQNLSIFFLIFVIQGAIVYAFNDLQFSPIGYVWASCHVVSMSFYACLVKFLNACENMNLNAQEMSFYNNLLSIPIILLFCFGKIMYNYDTMIKEKNVLKCLFQSLSCPLVFCVSLLGSYAVSVSGFAAQKVLSPVSWLTLNNFSKIPAILISVVIWGPILHPKQVLGLLISMSSAYCYSLSEQNYISKKHRKILMFSFVAIGIYSSMDPYTVQAGLQNFMQNNE